MSTIIPEIRVYSPSDKDDDSSDTIETGIVGLDDVKAMTNGLLGLGTDADARPKTGNTLFSRMSEQSACGVLDPWCTSKVKDDKFRATPCVHNGYRNLVSWENTFHMRPFNLANFPNHTAYRSTYRSQIAAMNRARAGCVASSAKSLDILRQNLQKKINKDIDDVLQKYLDKYFKPGIENIRTNNGENSVSDQHVQAVCRQILDEAKKMYHTVHVRGNSPSDFSDTEVLTSHEVRHGRYGATKAARKRHESDTDSEASHHLLKPKRQKGRPPIHHQGTLSGRSTPSKIKSENIKREGPKWDPARITSDTFFIMGARANKALGLGATRGRLYIKHPDIFKYSGDQDDKQWLYDHNFMSATGGKAYLLLVEDIRELAESEEYRSSPSVALDEIVGFTVPETMQAKIRTAMLLLRTDGPTRRRNRIAVLTDTASDRSSVMTDQKSESLGLDEKRLEEVSQTVSPVDDLDLLGNDVHSTDPSPFSLGPSMDDEVSPAPSDLHSISTQYDLSSTP